MYRKSNAAPAKLCDSGHLLMEHCIVLVVDAELTTADGYAERGHRQRRARRCSRRAPVIGSAPQAPPAQSYRFPVKPTLRRTPLGVRRR